MLASDWFVAYGRVSALAGLKEHGIEAYAPMETRWRRTRCRKHKVATPLLGSYLFVRVPPGRSHAEVRSVSGIAGFVLLDGAPARVALGDVAQLRIEEARGDFDKTRAERSFAPGQSLKITRGLFQGYTAAFIMSLSVEGRIKVMFKGMGMKGSATLDMEDVVAA